MIEELLAETRARHSTSPISQEDYDTWRINPVTVRLFEEMEMDVIGDLIDSDSTATTTDEVAMEYVSMKSEQDRIRSIIDWSPAGCKGADDDE